MKFLIVLLLGWMPGLALAQDSSVVGVWTWSGAGCRDQDLSARSHDSRSKSSGLMGVSASVLRLYDDGRAEMKTRFKDGNEDREGFYNVTEDDQVVINEEDFILSIVDNRLVIEGTYEESMQVCGGEGRVFVYVMGRVDEDPSVRP